MLLDTFHSDFNGHFFEERSFETSVISFFLFGVICTSSLFCRHHEENEGKPISFLSQKKCWFDIPLPWVNIFGSYSIIDIKKENISCPLYNSVFLETMLHARYVKVAFTGHDHLNDFCGKLRGTELESNLNYPWQSAMS